LCSPTTPPWKQGWFYLDNPAPVVPGRTGQAPVPYTKWTIQLTSRETEELHTLLDDPLRLKAGGGGVTGGTVAINFSRRLIQPIQDRVHPALKY
jgi:hypothetical protein